MSADLDTLSVQLYVAGDELLPSERCGGDHATGLAGAAGRAPTGSCAVFARSQELFDAGVVWLSGEEAGGLEHSELETRLEVAGRELLCQLFEDHLGLRALREQRIDGVVGADGVRRGSVEAGHERPLATVFGRVRVRRIAYRARGCENLHPADSALNLPAGKHSHGLRRMCAIESARGSFEDASDATWRATGQRVANRQVQELARASAVDFEDFYTSRRRVACQPGDALVLSCDGKGVVMRPEALREQTRKQAKNATTKLKTRLSKGEKRNRKRIAEVGAVYEIEPVPRTPADIMPATDAEREAASVAPAAKNKWLCASVTDDAATVVGRIFDEANRRDGEHQRPWVALVDGNNHQIDRIKKEAKDRKAKVTIVVDLVHVLEYLWGSAWCFFKEGDPAAEQWVRHHAQNVLAGKATRVAGAIKRQATNQRLDPPQRANADACATYLTNKAPHLDYPTALKQGWPIATGVIEGACRHLVKDRMDITGARWGLDGAEAVLKLRALRSNGDFDQYWKYHLRQERQRVHQSRYANNVIPSRGVRSLQKICTQMTSPSDTVTDGAADYRARIPRCGATSCPIWTMSSTMQSTACLSLARECACTRLPGYGSRIRRGR